MLARAVQHMKQGNSELNAERAQISAGDCRFASQIRVI